MKLHNVPLSDYFDSYSCGSVAIGCVLKKHPFHVQHDILKYRKKHPPKLNDYVVKSNYLDDPTITFFEEAKYFLRKYIKNHKTVTTKKPITTLRLVKYKLNPKNFYLVMSHEHLLIAHDKRIWDADGMGRKAEFNCYKNNKVICYIKLTPK